MKDKSDKIFMSEALKEARAAMAENEIPIGAVIVKDGIIIGRGRNKNEPFGHAEICAMREAAKTLHSPRLDGCTIYVTLEPCVMCSGALVQSRAERIVFAARDAKGGGCVSLYEIPRDTRMYHRCRITEGIMANEALMLLQTFFASKRSSRR